MKLAIVGAGSWGTALAIVLAPKSDSIRLWAFEKDLAEHMAKTRENNVFLPGFRLPESVSITTNLSEVVKGADVVLGVMPSHFARTIYQQLSSSLGRNTTIVSATKGIEISSLQRISKVISEVVPGNPVCVLSGPTFAREIAAGEPAAVVIACSEASVNQEIQGKFSTATFRLYTNNDVAGVEVGAALKNVIAIAAGVCEGLGLGSNIRAALITRGLAEISRLAVAMGGRQSTLSGLAGLGDLVLTCTGELSRNRRVGIELASGKTLRQILDATRMIPEGVETVEAAIALGRKFAVDLPITVQMHAVLHGERTPREALRELMERSLRGE